MSLAGRELSNIPRATVRLQIHAGFDLFAAAATVPYYAELGISHFYVSPLQRARSGSQHGYDGIDPSVIDAERGGREGLRQLVGELRAHGMGLILDIVPNHLSTSLENRWWYDVLECGRASAFADYFAIDWDTPDVRLKGRVLAPFLAATPDELFAAGRLSLVWDAAEARICIDADGQRYPLRRDLYATILAEDLPALSARFERGADDAADARQTLAHAVAMPELRACLDAALRRINADPAAFRRCLDAQAYELVHWKEAASRINWRRFFDLSELIALRCEDNNVFEACHALIFDLYGAGEIDGMRIDHVDGLTDPATYCRRLRERFARLAPQRPPSAPGGAAWIFVEKILGEGEPMRDGWGIDGSTGYDFMDQVGALLHAPTAQASLDALWSAVDGRSYRDIVDASRPERLREAFGADLARCLRAASHALPSFDETALGVALAALLRYYPRYRGYARPNEPDRCDDEVLRSAVSQASLEVADEGALMALADLYGGAAAEETVAASAAIAAFQQLCSPLAARAIEDTAFYRFGRLLSRNEVGATPSTLSIEPEQFHAAAAIRARDWPRTLLTTASHDHKRGEDARMRIASLTDCAAHWRAQVERWLAARDTLDAPDAADFAMLCQTLVGVWPDERCLEIPDDLRGRIEAWQLKSTRERKEHGSWTAPDPDYEQRAKALLHGLLDDARFLDEHLSIVRRVARASAVRSLSQATLRCTSPGIPDLYQGTEFWDFSLVDPDNRRTVDHAARRQALASRQSDVELLADWRSGHVKQRLIQRLLRLRGCHADVFQGTYRPLPLSGQHADHFIAFVRAGRAEQVAVVVPIRPPALLGAGDGLGLNGPFDAAISLGSAGRAWNVVSQNWFDADVELSLNDVLGTWPVAALLMECPHKHA